MAPKLDLVDRLRKLLAQAGLGDSQIQNGVGLTPDGQRKAARILGIEVDELPLLMASLVQRIRDEAKRYDVMIEDLETDGVGRRYSVEPDALGNATVRDAQLGREVFLSGQRASALMNRLKGATDAQKQSILAHYAPLMEAPLPRVKRAMTANQEDPEQERPHWEAKDETGFYGRQGAGCIIVAQRTGRVLLSHRSGSVEEPHTWGNWGGAVDEGVDPLTHCMHEVYQECGYEGNVVAQVPLYVFRKGSFRYSNFMFVVPDEFTPDLNWESQGYRWCEYGHWPSPLHFGLAALFNDPDSARKIKAVCSAAVDPGVHESLDEEDEHVEVGDDEIEPAILDEEEDFEEEIRQSTGSYNFPWNAGGRHGTATARYRTVRGEMKVEVFSVRDDTGEEIDAAGRIASIIHQQAIDFIGHE